MFKGNVVCTHSRLMSGHIFDVLQIIHCYVCTTADVHGTENPLAKRPSDARIWQESAKKQHLNKLKTKMKTNQLEDSRLQTFPQVRPNLSFHQIRQYKFTLLHFWDSHVMFGFPIRKYFKLIGYSLMYVAHHLLPSISLSFTSHMPVKMGRTKVNVVLRAVVQ